MGACVDVVAVLGAELEPVPLSAAPDEAIVHPASRSTPVLRTAVLLARICSPTCGFSIVCPVAVAAARMRTLGLTKAGLRLALGQAERPQLLRLRSDLLAVRDVRPNARGRPCPVSEAVLAPEREILVEEPHDVDNDRGGPSVASQRECTGVDGQTRHEHARHRRALRGAESASAGER